MFIFELQIGRDDRKCSRSMPHRTRGCQEDSYSARSAHVFQPIVLGPDEIPRITDLAQARAMPELTLLSALVHCRAPGGEHALHAALAAACPMLDSELRVLYFSIVEALISDDVLRPQEALMHFEGNSLDAHVARYYYNRGAKEAGAETLHALLVKLLTQRFGSLSEDAMTRIQNADADRLTHWGERLLSAASLDDVLDSMP
jgi:hypothetical protein